MKKHLIVARTFSGGRDLNLGVPDVLNAAVTKVDYDETINDYDTYITLALRSGEELVLCIRQSK